MHYKDGISWIRKLFSSQITPKCWNYIMSIQKGKVFDSIEKGSVQNAPGSGNAKPMRCAMKENWSIHRCVKTGKVFRSWILSWYSKMPSTVATYLILLVDSVTCGMKGLTVLSRLLPIQCQLSHRALGPCVQLPGFDQEDHLRCFWSILENGSVQTPGVAVDIAVPRDLFGYVLHG